MTKLRVKFYIGLTDTELKRGKNHTCSKMKKKNETNKLDIKTFHQKCLIYLDENV